ncbi:hypothetical protein BJX64DRAFT_288917 [Aspergillus heterothallicus]
MFPTGMQFAAPQAPEDFFPPPPAPPPPPTLDLYIAFGRRPHPECQQHWLLLLTLSPTPTIPPQTHPLATYYSVTTTGSTYTHAITPHQPLHNPSFESTGKLATLPLSAATIVNSIARAVTPQRCPLYVTSLLFELEFAGMLAPGVAAFYADMVPPSMVQWAVREKGMLEVLAVSVCFDAAQNARRLGLGDVEYDMCFF